MKKIILILIVFVFLAGCGSGFYSLGEEDYNLSLDKALALLQERYSDNMYYDHDYFIGLNRLWSEAQVARQDDDKEIIEKEMLTVLLKGLDIYRQERQEDILHVYDHTLFGSLSQGMDFLRERATTEEVKSEAQKNLSELVRARRERESEEHERKQEEWEQKEHKRVEVVRAEFERSRERLTKISKGTLRDKSTQEVKKLVDEWRQESLRRELPSKEYPAFFSAATFYKIFGKPERKQFLSSIGQFTPDFYIFYYNCKDGIVQIQVSAGYLDDGIVIIKELNIF